MPLPFDEEDGDSSGAVTLFNDGVPLAAVGVAAEVGDANVAGADVDDAAPLADDEAVAAADDADGESTAAVSVDMARASRGGDADVIRGDE